MVINEFYFSYTFSYAQYAISVRTGGLLPINVCRTAKSPKNDIHQWKVLCIEGKIIEMCMCLCVCMLIFLYNF